MTIILTSGLLLLFGVFFLYTSLISFLRPAIFGKSLSLDPLGASGIVEIRAQYGGFFAAAALSQFAPFVSLISPITALLFAAIIFGGLIVGRIGAWFVKERDQNLSPMIRSLYAIDAFGFVSSVGAIAALSFSGATI